LFEKAIDADLPQESHDEWKPIKLLCWLLALRPRKIKVAKNQRPLTVAATSHFCTFPLSHSLRPLYFVFPLNRSRRSEDGRRTTPVGIWIERLKRNAGVHTFGHKRMCQHWEKNGWATQSIKLIICLSYWTTVQITCKKLNIILSVT